MNQSVMVVGLGLMGSALAKTLLENDYPVAVWNRTSQKKEPLVALGARAALSVAEGVHESDTILLCLRNYDDCFAVLDDCPSLAGKTVIQLTTASAGQAAQMKEWVEKKGARYLDGAIIAYPSGIGTQGSMLIMAGDEAAWVASEALIRVLGPASRYVGSDVAVPAALDFAIIFSSVVSQLAVIQGFHLLEDRDISADTYADFITPLFGKGVAEGLRKQLQKIAQNDFGQPDATISTWRSALAEASDTGDNPKNTELVESVQALLDRAIDAGEGEKDLIAMIRYMRGSKS